MDPRLSKLREGNAQRAEGEHGWKVAEYQKLMADLIERAKTELKTLKEIAPATLTIIAQAEKRYPRSETDPPNLKKSVGDFNDALRVARGICQKNPVILQNMIDRVENAKSEDFRFFSPKVMANEDRIRLSPLLNGSEFLKKLPMELAVLETFITHAVAYWAEREKNGGGWKPPATANLEPVEKADKEEKDFDVRLS